MRVTRSFAVTTAAVVAVAAGSLALRAEENIPVETPSAAEAVDAGTLVEIGPDEGLGKGAGVDPARRGRRLGRRLTRPGFAEAPVAVSRYMIGISGGALPAEVRAQVDLPANEGVLVRDVDTNGPAEQAGVEPFDIVTRANGDPINDLGQLAEIVGEQGEMKGRIALELLRRGRRQTVWVTPVERPIEPASPRRRFGDRQGGGGFGGGFGGGLADGFGGGGLGDLLGEGALNGDFGELFEQFGLQQGRQSFLFGGPDGAVSVNVMRNNDQAGQVTVRSGDQTWEFATDDAEALAALPDGVRPLVERVLQGQSGQFDIEFGPGGLRLQLGEMRRRMQLMEQETSDLRRQLDEAPAFQPEDSLLQIESMEPELAEPIEEGPTELEIPADAE